METMWCCAVRSEKAKQGRTVLEFLYCWEHPPPRPDYGRKEATGLNKMEGDLGTIVLDSAVERKWLKKGEDVTPGERGREARGNHPMYPTWM